MASKSRLVVPSDLVELERAEQTTATLCNWRYSGMIVPVIASSNLPTLVPPYFCTTQVRDCVVWSAILSLRMIKEVGMISVHARDDVASSLIDYLSSPVHGSHRHICTSCDVLDNFRRNNEFALRPAAVEH